MAIAAAAAIAPAHASAACSLSAPVIPCIEMSVPSSHAFGTLAPGATHTSAEQAVVVSSNQGYGVRIAADLADGRMKEWDGGAYVAGSPRVLGAPLEWGLSSINAVPQAPAYAALSSTAAPVVSGRSATACVLGLLCGSDTIGVRLRQAVSFADRRVAPNAYRIQVTYTAQHGW